MMVKIVTLMEDTKGHSSCFYEHGLSLYIETKHHHILFDTGASELTLKNAQKLNVDLQSVDVVIISHGHYDHGGGLLAFSKINKNAKIYIQKNAMEDYCHGQKYIGLDDKVKELPQIQWLEGNQQIDDELFLFTHITGRQYFSKSNLELTKRVAGKDVEDDFLHEQCLVIHDGKGDILLSGCAHNGIINILEKYKELFHNDPQLVISGFHLSKKTEYTKEEINNIKDIAYYLNQLPIQFYTGHCTGKKAYDIMKEIMQEKLHYLHCGDIIS